ncbi:MAG: acetyl-CoA carboxylase, carboxyltransferase subunit beta [Bacilli bacterium]|nr:acetyl-CoA carboxylase, carboxyltransferase subunit beta [Bacilli bacterium]
MNDFIDKRKKMLEAFKKEYRNRTNEGEMRDIPKDMFVKCEECNELLLVEDVEKNLWVCPKCGFHFRISARLRLKALDSNNTFVEMNQELSSVNPLDFPQYLEKVEKYQTITQEKEAVITGTMMLGNIPIAIGIMDSFFMMGSMGSVVGEKITRLIEKATMMRLPLIIFCASGGARMQEGMFSLMQMAKTTMALTRHDASGLLSIMVLTHPTTGGVAASFATLGDIIIAEHGALIGFAGPRVIEQTIHETLPQDFQKAEFLLEKGFVDIVTTRRELLSLLIKCCSYHEVAHE